MKDITMKKDIKDYIHLYIGCEVLALDPYSENEQAMGYLTGIHGEYGPEIQFIIDGNVEESPEYPNYENVKPILRKLSSMTEEEASECYHHKMGGSYAVTNPKYALQGHFFPDTSVQQMALGVGYLLSKGFWLFGDDWFDEGLILDKDTVK